MQEDLGGPTVCVTFTLTFDEYDSAISSKRARQLGLLFPWLGNVSVVILLFVLFIAALGICSGMLFSLEFIALLLLGRQFVRQQRDARLALKKWQANADLREPHTYIFSPSGVQISWTLGSANVSWKEIEAAESSSSLFLLAGRCGELYIVPERAFTIPEDRRRFQQLAEALVPTCRF
jgi:hypothetical protein